MPDAIFIVDTHKEVSVVREARAKSIPIVGIVDTNADPTLVDHAIPANDDAVRSVKLIVEKVAQAYAAGKAKAEKKP